MNIKPISPSLPEATELIDQSTVLMASFYPECLCNLENAASLASDDAYFIGLFIAADLVGIGAVKLRKHDIIYGEIKRVFIKPGHRGKGFSKPLMQMLEAYLIKQGIFIARLETGVKQPAAISLYKTIGYKTCPPFGIYQEDPRIIFMEKQLK